MLFMYILNLSAIAVVVELDFVMSACWVCWNFTLKPFVTSVVTSVVLFHCLAILLNQLTL